MAAHQAHPSLGFSKEEHWSGLPFPSPMHESEKWKWSCSVMSDLATPWTAASQAPLSMGFSRQEYWSGVPFQYKTKGFVLFLSYCSSGGRNSVALKCWLESVSGQGYWQRASLSLPHRQRAGLLIRGSHSCFPEPLMPFQFPSVHSTAGQGTSVCFLSASPVQVPSALVCFLPQAQPETGT